MADISPDARAGAGSALLDTIYLLLFPVPVVCFLAALATDVAYLRSAYLMWLHFSEWLIAAGLAVGALAALALLLGLATRRGMRTRLGWSHLALFLAALLVELVNALVHTADGWTAVAGSGVTLSVIGAALALGAVGTLMLLPVRPLGRREAWA